MQPSAATITAIATAPGRAGIGVIRISGAGAVDIATGICGRQPRPRMAEFARFTDCHGDTIDQGLILYFPPPKSYTGEATVELHAHGGRVVLDQLLARVIELGARLAQPGEFTQRAFLNDKLDLAQAEAVADLIDATSQQAARAAVRSLQGQFSRQVEAILNDLVGLRVDVESAIDFPEEEIDFLGDGSIISKSRVLLARIDELIANATQGNLLREGINIVIAGKPNAGKSSLLNALAGQDRAIVTAVPGTTRDVLKETITIDGLPVNIFDTAGLRETEDVVEKEGVKRAQLQIEQADCVLKIIDISAAKTTPGMDLAINNPIPVITVYNKIDLVGETEKLENIDNQVSIYLSARYGNGINLLQDQLKKTIGYNAHTEGVFIARRRHLNALESARGHLCEGIHVLQASAAGELLAEDLRHAQSALNEITGEFSSDDLLGKIFATFCIGK